MTTERRQREGFFVERHDDDHGVSFVYQGHLTRLELRPMNRKLEVFYPDLDERHQWDDFLETLWQLCPVGVVDVIEVWWARREGENSIERQR